MKLTGAQIFFECLKQEGVEVVFGFPGGAVLDIYNQIPNYNTRHILVRHEQGAAHMADGYARATGRVGVCLVTSGPGATNAVTGVATAYMHPQRRIGRQELQKSAPPPRNGVRVIYIMENKEELRPRDQ